MVDQTADRIVSGLSPGEPRPGGARLTSNLGALHAYEEGVDEYDRSSDDGAAAASFHRAVELDPQFAMAYFELAKLLPGYRARHEAIIRAAVLAERQRLPELQRLLIHARQLVIDDRLEEAVQKLRTIVRRFPKEIEPRVYLGTHLTVLGRFKEGTAVLEEAAKQDDPSESLAWNQLAYNYAFQQDSSQALDAADRYAALLPPDDPNPIDTRADVYSMGGHQSNALAEYQRNLRAHPNFSYTREKIALVYLLAGQNREAAEAAQAAYEKAGDADRGVAREVQGDVLLRNGNLDLAAKYYQQASVLSESDPSRSSAQAWKAAEIYFEEGKPKAALDMAKSLPGFGAAEVRGVAYLLLGDHVDAENEFTSARSAMVPYFSDYRVNTLIALDRLRAAKFASRWRQIIDGWPALTDDLKPQNGFLAGRAYAELALPQAEAEMRTSQRFLCAGGLISDDINFLQLELADFYLAKALEHEGKRPEAVKSYRTFLSHFEHSSAALPQIKEARNAVLRLQ